MSIFDEDDDSISTITYFKLRKCPYKTQMKVSFTVRKELEEKDLNSKKTQTLASDMKAKKGSELFFALFSCHLHLGIKKLLWNGNF